MTTTATRSRKRTWWQWIGYLARRATVAELRGYQSIYRFVFRRPRVPAGAVGFSYHQPILAILIVFIVVSAVEVVVVDFIVHRWAHVRIPLLVISIWGLVWMFGLLFGMLIRPHAVGPDGIRVRYGAEVDLPIAWDDIYSVSKRKRIIQAKEPKVTVDEYGDATLHLRIGDETNIELKPERPLELRLPHGSETVGKVTLYVDEPKAFMDVVRRHIG
jgi:hypothetical protein